MSLFRFSSQLIVLLVSLSLPLQAVAASPSANSCAATTQKLVQAICKPELKLPKIPGAKSWGPRVYYRYEAKPDDRKWDQIERISLGQFNILNYIKLKGKYKRNPVTGEFEKDPVTGQYIKELPEIEKSLKQQKDVKNTIDRADADILTVEEIGGMGEAVVLERDVKGAYRPIVIEGNDTRDIDIGFFVKKDLPFDIEVQSFKNVAQANGQVPLFSRDLPVMLLRKPGSPEDSKPFMIVIGTHFKSQRGSQNDPRGAIARGKQVDAAAEIIKYYEELYGKVPIFLKGDFNAEVRSAPEFKPLWEKVRMKDSFDLAPPDMTVPRDQRTTQTYHPRGEPVVHSQLDSISGNKTVQEEGIVREATIIPYYDDAGNPRPLPRTYDEREQQGSDHRMLKTVLDFTRIRKLFERN